MLKYLRNRRDEPLFDDDSFGKARSSIGHHVKRSATECLSRTEATKTENKYYSIIITSLENTTSNLPESATKNFPL